jgi:hypothetical protein
MHPSSLAARNDNARRRIKAAAAELGEALGVPPLATPNPAENRQPAVAQMRELECLADLLESITAALTVEAPHGN